MLKRITVCTLSLLLMAAVSSFAYGEGSTAEEKAPTIGELAEFAGLDVEVSLAEGEKAAAEEVAPGPVVDAEAEELLADFSEKEKIAAAKRKTEAAAKVEEAIHRLYVRKDAQGAYDLARAAMLLDPENAEAEDIKIEAGMQLGVPAEIYEFKKRKYESLPRVRKDNALQALRNTMAEARQLYAEGNFEGSLARWRKARLYVELLSVYMDVQSERGTVERMVRTVEGDYAEQQRALEATRRAEAKTEQKDRVDRIAEVGHKKKGAQVEELLQLIEDKQFHKARLIIDDLEVEDPTDEYMEVLRERNSRDKWEHWTRKSNYRRERGKRENFLDLSYRDSLPEGPFEYPDLAIWREIVDARQPVLYPAVWEDAAEKVLNQPVTDQLGSEVDLSFDGTELEQVIQFLQQTTPVNYHLIPEDIPADGAPVSLTMKTSLENALDQITEQTGMAWEVEGGLIKMGRAESLHDYSWRQYPVADLLVDSTDPGGGGGGGGGGGFTPQFSSASAGLSAQVAGPSAAGVLGARVSGVATFLMQVCNEEQNWAALAPVGGAPVAPTGPGPGFEDFENFGQFGDEEFEFEQLGPPGLTPGLPGMPLVGLGEILVVPNQVALIYVHQIPSVHECIEERLRELRLASKIQVVVDTRFLSVTTDFMREFGFQWPDLSVNPFDQMSGPFNSLEGWGMNSGNFGGWDPYLTPLIYSSFIGIDPLSAAANPEYLPIYTQDVFNNLFYYLGFPSATPDSDLDSQTGVITYERGEILKGFPFIGTKLAGGSGGMNMEFGYGDEDILLTGFFRAALERNEASLLSAPQITLANGQQGTMTANTVFTYVATYDVDEGVLIPQTDTATDDVTVTVRPVVSHDQRYVFMEISPSIATSDLSTTVSFTTFTGQPGGGEGGATGATVTNFITLPEQKSDNLATTVGVPDRGVAIFGGLTSSRRAHSETGIPLLSKIPILKRLFTGETRAIDQEVRYFMVSPRIVIIREEEVQSGRGNSFGS